jgi:hypothetical protein
MGDKKTVFDAAVTSVFVPWVAAAACTSAGHVLSPLTVLTFLETPCSNGVTLRLDGQHEDGSVACLTWHSQAAMPGQCVQSAALLPWLQEPDRCLPAAAAAAAVLLPCQPAGIWLMHNALL